MTGLSNSDPDVMVTVIASSIQLYNYVHMFVVVYSQNQVPYESPS